MRYLLCRPFHLPLSFRVMILFLALGVLPVCHAVDPEESAEYKAYKEAGESSDYAQALVLAEALRDKYPDSSVGWNATGTAHGALGDLEEAIESFNRAIKLDPDDAIAHDNLGHALFQQGQLDKAIESFRRAIGLDPELAMPHFHLGTAFDQLGKTEEAIKSYRRAIKLDPELAMPHYNLGTALGQQGYLDEAIQSFHRAIKLDPNYAEAHNNLGLALKQQGYLDKAIESFHRAIKLDPELAMAHYNLGIVFAKQSKTEEAITSYRRAIKFGREDIKAHYNLGIVLNRQGETEEAIKSFRRAIELGPTSLKLIANLASAHAKLEQFDSCGIWCARLGLVKGVADEASLVKQVRATLRQLKVEVPAEEPTDQAVRAYYEANKETFSGVAVHLRTLTIPKSKWTREFVDELRAKLVAGDGDFAAAAKKYSYDLASTKGGDHGWVKRGDLRQDLIDVAFALKAGEFSAVIEDDSHYRILNTVEHRDGSLAPLEKVRQQIVAELIKEAPTKRIKGWIEQARKEHAEAMDGA